MAGGPQGDLRVWMSRIYDVSMDLPWPEVPARFRGQKADADTLVSLSQTTRWPDILFIQSVVDPVSSVSRARRFESL